jgi:RNA polymerase sigma-70 factor (ECF subfamily)
MQSQSDELIRTRTTLIKRLKDWQDQASWQDFFDTYWKLIYSVAVKSGLTETEAQDVVQETMFSIAKQMPDFKYDRSLGSFKAWLLKLTRWRITDQYRKREPMRSTAPASLDDQANSAEILESVADASHIDLEGLWEREWRRNILETAVAKAKRNVDPMQYQIFDMYVNKHWTPDKVAKTFRVTTGQVYLAKHRVMGVVKKEIERMTKVLD